MSHKNNKKSNKLISKNLKYCYVKFRQANDDEIPAILKIGNDKFIFETIKLFKFEEYKKIGFESGYVIELYLHSNNELLATTNFTSLNTFSFDRPFSQILDDKWNDICDGYRFDVLITKTIDCVNSLFFKLKEIEIDANMNGVIKALKYGKENSSVNIEQLIINFLQEHNLI